MKINVKKQFEKDNVIVKFESPKDSLEADVTLNGSISSVLVGVRAIIAAIQESKKIDNEILIEALEYAIAQIKGEV